MLKLFFDQLVAEVALRLRTLPDKPEENAAATVSALWHKAVGRPLSVEKACQIELPELNEQSKSELQALIEKRLQGTPLAHLTGRQQFMNIEFIVNGRALIPRKETELLGYTVLNLLNDIHKKTNGPPRAIDLCTGSGNLACALAVHAPDLRVTGSDISIDALTCAMENKLFHGLHDRVAFVAGDLLHPFNLSCCREKATMIVCNPPYISDGKMAKLPTEIAQHEPREAFNGGPLGVSILSRLVKDGADYLVSGGLICCEVGLGQGKWLAQRFERTNNFQRVQTFSDSAGEIRVVAAQRK